MKLVAICGRAGAGKDTLAQSIAEAYGFEVIHLAGPLKDLVAKYLGRPIDKAVDRHYLVDIGQWCKGRFKEFPRSCIHPDAIASFIEEEDQVLASILWIEKCMGQPLDTMEFTEDYWLLRLIARMHPDKSYVIPDLRFPVESDWLRSKGAYIVKLHADIETCEERLTTRDGSVPEGIWKAVSETELSLIEPHLNILVDNLPPSHVFSLFDSYYRKAINVNQSSD